MNGAQRLIEQSKKKRNGTEINSAPNLTPSKSIEFDFTDGSVLKISEHTESILQFNSLEIICEGEKNLKTKNL